MYERREAPVAKKEGGEERKREGGRGKNIGLI